MMKNLYETVIGLEIHAQLSTKTKIFCGCSTSYTKDPNTNTCPVCLGHPGVLPVLNSKAVDYAVKMGIALNCKIKPVSVFARKSYFYPDLPKGYQISQYDKPLCEDGFILINVDNELKKIRIKRIHLEEDAGKLIHDKSGFSKLDANRCGIPLIEIVSEPDISTPDEAVKYLEKIKQTLLYLGICDCNMEEGSLRCDANISIRPKGQAELGTKAEIKNLNSFKFLAKALSYEINRQIDMIEDGEEIIQETLLWDEGAEETISMRSKEDAHDYRYFPDPDLVYLNTDEKFIAKIKDTLEELPDQKEKRFSEKYKLKESDIKLLTLDKNIAGYFEEAAAISTNDERLANFIISEVFRILKIRNLDIKDFPVSSKRLADLINLIENGTINNKTAKDILELMLNSEKEPLDIVKEKGLLQVIDENQISALIDSVLLNYKNEVDEYKNGKEKVFGFLIGKIMQQSKGKANPQIVNKFLKQKLN